MPKVKGEKEGARRGVLAGGDEDKIRTEWRGRVRRQRKTKSSDREPRLGEVEQDPIRISKGKLGKTSQKTGNLLRNKSIHTQHHPRSSF